MNETTYKFTREQLTNLLHGSIQMFLEYRDVHGKDEEAARWAAVAEEMEGLDADRELVAMGEKPVNLQVFD